MSISLSQELVQQLEEFLGKTLEKENLSKSANKERVTLLEELEINKLPPALPVRINLPKVPKTVAAAKKSKFNNFPDAGSASETVENGDYADIDLPSQQRVLQKAKNTSYDEYEIPKEFKNLPCPSDSDSGTDYEPYDDDFDTVRRGSEVQLPTKAVKQKKSKEDEFLFASIKNVSWKGFMYHKRKIFGNRRFCATDETKLYLFKSTETSKLYTQLTLSDVNVCWSEKETSVTSHVFKLTKVDGSGEVNLESNVEDVAQLFAEELQKKVKSFTKQGPSESGYNSEQSSVHQRPISDISCESDSLPPSEGNSADGVTPSPATLTKSATLPESARKFSLSGFLSLGKNKAGKIQKKLLELNEIAEKLEKPELNKAGHVKVMSEKLFHNKRWHKRYCTIINNVFRGYKDVADPFEEFSVDLTEVKCGDAKLPKHPFAVQLMSDETIVLIMEATEKMDHGDWVSALIKATETTTASPCDAGIYSEIEAQRGVQDTTENIYDDVRTTGPITWPQKVDKPPALPTSSPPQLSPTTNKKATDVNDNDMYVNKMRSSDDSDDYVDNPTSKQKPDSTSEISRVYLSMSSCEQETVESDSYGVFGDNNIPEVKRSKTKIAEIQEQLQSARNSTAGASLECDYISPSKNNVLHLLHDSSPLTEEEEQKTVDRVDELLAEVNTAKRNRGSVQLKRTNARLKEDRDKWNMELDQIDAQIEKAEEEMTKLKLLLAQKGSHHGTRMSVLKTDAKPRDSPPQTKKATNSARNSKCLDEPPVKKVSTLSVFSSMADPSAVSHAPTRNIKITSTRAAASGDNKPKQSTTSTSSQAKLSKTSDTSKPAGATSGATGAMSGATVAMKGGLYVPKTQKREETSGDAHQSSFLFSSKQSSHVKDKLKMWEQKSST